MRRAHIVLLCEDKQQDVLVRRVIKKLRPKDHVRTVPMPCGRGSGEQFVRNQFPRELKAQRTKAVASVLVVVVDGDAVGIEGRHQQLNEACKAADVATRTDGDRVAIAVPARNIETWLCYLGGQDVTETEVYPPRSLETACADYRDAFRAG